MSGLRLTEFTGLVGLGNYVKHVINLHESYRLKKYLIGNFYNSEIMYNRFALKYKVPLIILDERGR